MSLRKSIGVGLILSLVIIGILAFVQPVTRGMETSQRQDVLLQAFGTNHSDGDREGSQNTPDVIHHAPVAAVAVDLQNLVAYDNIGESQYDRWLRGDIDLGKESLLTPDEIEAMQLKALKLPSSERVGAISFSSSNQLAYAPPSSGIGFDSIDVDDCCGGGTNVPPDPEMAAGPDRLIAIVNVAFEIYDTAGTSLVAPTTLSNFFAPLGGTNCTGGGPFDPNVLYDEERDRFMIAADGDGNAYCVGVSQTNDPTGAWYLYEFPTNVGGNFFDYPHAGIGRDAIYMGANMFGASYVEARVWAFDKNAMYAGLPAAFVTRSTGDDDTPQPVNLHGYDQGTWPSAGPHYFLTDRDFNGATYALHSWEDPFGADIFTTEAVFDLPAVHGVAVGFPVDVVQPAPGLPITANDFRPLDFEYRNGLGYTAMTVACNPGGGTVNCVQWAVIDLAGASVVDTGVHASDGEYLFFPDVAANACGDMAIGFTVSSSSLYPSVAVTGRKAGDPAGTVLPGFLAKAGEEAYAAFDGSPYRWGDYSGMTIAPDGQTFWYLGEYSKDVTNANANWGDWIQSASYDDCVAEAPGPNVNLVKTVGTDAGVCAASNVIEVLTGTDVSYCYTITNTGDTTLSLHDLVDSELGTLLDDFATDLAPGDSVEYIVDGVTIDVTTINTATWTAFNNDPAASASSDSYAVVNVVQPPTEELACNIGLVGFDSGIPGNWVVVDNEGSGIVWSSIAGAGESGNYTGGAGDAATVSSDAFGAAEFDTELITPVFSLAEATSASLEYLVNYQNFASLDFLDVDITTDGGATWTNLLSWNEDHGSFRAAPGESVSLDLNAYVGMSNLQLRWRYYDPNTGDWDWYAQIDDVGLSCEVPATLVCNAAPVSFDAGLPSTWSVIDNEGTGVVWTNVAGSGEAGNYTSGAGDAASVSSDAFGAAEFDTELRSDPFDIPADQIATIEYLANYQNFAALDFLNLDISADGGATWSTLLGWNEDHGGFRTPPGEAVSVDLSAYSGMSGLMLRWHYFDPNSGDWDWYAQVDDVALGCVDATVPPIIDVDPAAMFSTLPVGGSETQALTISNLGEDALDWNIDEAEEGAAAAAASANTEKVNTAVANVPAKMVQDAYSPAPGDILMSEGFEGGVIPPAGWDLISSNINTWQLHNLNPYAGAYSTEVLYDPALVPQDEWLLGPELSLTSGVLSFWSSGSLYWCRDTFDNCDLNVWLIVGGVPGDGDDIYVGTADGDWTDTYIWSQSVFNLDGLLPGGPVQIGFQYTGLDGAQITVDEVILDGTEGEPTGCAAPLDLPWLSVSPDAGTTAGADSTAVDVMFDAAGLTPGIYQGLLCVHSNDPATPLVEVPVELTVEAASGTGLLYLSANSDGVAGNVAYADEDIIVYDKATGDYAVYFDGSDVGVKSTDVDALQVLADGSILMSFEQKINIAGFGKVQPQDIVKFIPTATGEDTAGSFEMYFDGSEYGLKKYGEGVDAIAFTPDGRLVVSTLAAFKVPQTGGGKLRGADDDLIALNASGDWEMYLDGSDVWSYTEDVWGAWIDAATGDVYLSMQNAFTAGAVSGDELDVFIGHPISMGWDTSMDFGPGLFFDGSAEGFGGDVIDGFSVAP